MLNFEFLNNGLGIISPPPFAYDFSRKIFLMPYSFKGSIITELQNRVTKPSFFCFCFSIWVFFRDHSRITGLQGKGEVISLTPPPLPPASQTLRH